MTAATTGLGFQPYDENISTSNILQRHLLTASTQYYENDACILSDGIAGQISTAEGGPVTHIFQVMVTPAAVLRPGTANLSTTAGEKGLFVPVGTGVAGGFQPLNFLTPLTANDSIPPINGTACNSNSTATSVLVTAAGSTNDYATGTIYIPSLQQQRTITADTVSGGVHTFTVTPAFSRAVTTGDTAIVVPFSPGSVGIEHDSTNPYQGISSQVADKTGGHVNIVKVVLGAIQEGADLGYTLTKMQGGTPYAVVNFS
jgi:hypothetical protein